MPDAGADTNKVSERSGLEEWVRHLPKAEIHLHLEGCIPLEIVAGALSESRVASTEPAASAAPPVFSDLTQFLDYLDRSCKLVTRGDQVESIAYGIARRARESGVGHVDVIFNPTHWPAWRHRLDELVARLDSGLSAGEMDYGVSAGLCLSLKRTQPAVESVELVDWVLSAHPERIVGLSVDGNEADAGPTAARFAPLFARARAAQLRTCAHAGESSGPEGVRAAVEILRIDRIDHGIRAIEDPSVVAELAARAIPLDVCPTSNVRLGVVPSIGDHPIERLRAAGVPVSVNTDDPLLFGTSVASEYMDCAAAFGWDRCVLGEIARTSIEASFATEHRRRALLALLDEHLGATASTGVRSAGSAGGSAADGG